MSGKPWYEARPGAPITARAWNGWQVGFRTALEAHDHTGGERGAPLGGESFDPASDLAVRSLDLSEAARVGGVDLGEQAKTAAEEMARLLEPEIAKALPKAGGELIGGHTVTGGVRSRTLKVGGKLIVGGKEIAPPPAARGSEHATFAPHVPVDLADAFGTFTAWGGAIQVPLSLDRRSLVLFSLPGRQSHWATPDEQLRVAVAGAGAIFSVGNELYNTGTTTTFATARDWESRSAIGLQPPYVTPQGAEYPQYYRTGRFFTFELPAGTWTLLIGMMASSSGTYALRASVVTFPCAEVSHV